MSEVSIKGCVEVDIDVQGHNAEFCGEHCTYNSNYSHALCLLFINERLTQKWLSENEYVFNRCQGCLNAFKLSDKGMNE